MPDGLTTPKSQVAETNLNSSIEYKQAANENASRKNVSIKIMAAKTTSNKKTRTDCSARVFRTYLTKANY
jgi:hypothetical protein